MSEFNYTPFHHHFPIQIRFNDVDLFGHVNNAVYQHFYDIAKPAFFEKVLGDKIDWKKQAFILASLKIDFFEPIYLNSDIEVQTKIASIGNKSLMLEQQVVDKEKNTVKSHCVATMVCVSPKTGISEIIPQEWRDKMETYQKNADE
jgi:acyl-CoA thioester hydrolase